MNYNYLFTEVNTGSMPIDAGDQPSMTLNSDPNNYLEGDDKKESVYRTSGVGISGIIAMFASLGGIMMLALLGILLYRIRLRKKRFYICQSEDEDDEDDDDDEEDDVNEDEEEDGDHDLDSDSDTDHDEETRAINVVKST